MIDASKVLYTIEKATQATQKYPYRQGRVLRIPDASDILVVGDLHGRMDLFKKAVQLADLKANPGRHLVIQELMHGTQTYEDGSDNSHLTVDMVALLKCQFPLRVHYLIGNHELSQATNRRVSKNGKDLNQLFDMGVAFAYPEHTDQFLEAYRKLVEELPALILLPNGVTISHSLPDSTKIDSFDVRKLEVLPTTNEETTPGGSLHSLLWGRDTSEHNAQAFLEKVRGKWLISGHIPVFQGVDFPNPRQIVLDAHLDVGGYALIPGQREISPGEFHGLAGVLQ